MPDPMAKESARLISATVNKTLFELLVIFQGVSVELSDMISSGSANEFAPIEHEQSPVETISANMDVPSQQSLTEITRPNTTICRGEAMEATRDVFIALLRSASVRSPVRRRRNYDRTIVQLAHRPSEFKERIHENNDKAQYSWFLQFLAHRRGD